MPQIIAAVGAAMTAVGVAIGKALTAFGVGAYTAGVVGGMAVKFGVQVAIVWATSKLLAPKLDNVGARQADVLELSLGEHPREAIFGRAATGGTLIDAFNWGGSQNDWEAMVIALADHECHALVGFYVDDKYVAFAGDGNVSGYSDSNGAALQVFFLPGTSAQTLPATVGAGPNAMSFVSASGGRWTADDRLLGVAAVIVCYRFTPEILGGRPVFRWVVDGKKCYDPRLDSTVTGGSGAHRWDNPATHAWTENAAICRYNYLRGVYVNSQLILGPGRSAEEAPPADVIGPANVCDETVALLAGGTVKRYTVSAVVRADEPWIDVEEAFAAAMGAELIERSGMIVIEPGASKAVAKTFVDADLLSDFPVEVQAKLSRRDLVNTVSATYVDPSQMYEEQTAPIRRASEDISADGEVRDRPLALRFVTSGNQAQRLGEIERRKARLQRTANVTLGPRFSVLEVGDWVTWQGSIYNPGATAQEIVSRSGAVIVSRSGADIVSSIDTSGANRTYMVVSAAVDDAQRITLGLREIASNVYAWTAAIDELDPNQPAFVAPTPPAGWSTGSNNVLWSDIFGANRPSDNATQNRVYSQPSEPTGVVDGDIWHDTDANPPITYYRVAGVWATGPNLATNTNQLTDGAALGQTANWPQVTGSGRPADNATVGARAGADLRNFADTVTLGDADVITSQGTAADFTGRGPWATVTTPVADVLAPNPNLFPFPSPIWGGNFGGSTPAPSSYFWEGDAIGTLYFQPFGGPIYFRARSGGAAVTEYYYFDVPNALAGQQYTVSLNGYVTGGTFVPYASCLDASKNALSVHNMSVDAASSRWRITFTAVANTAFIRVVIRADFNGVGYQDVVFNRIKLEYGSQMTPLSSPLELAPRQASADVTGSNTAADFSGRGALATANFYRQSSDPGAVADGSLWTDTSVTPNLLKQRISGAWQTIATANTTPTQLTATASPKSRVKTRSGAGSATTDTVTVTAAGGTSPYTYAWSQLSGKSATATASTSATTAFQYTVAVGEENETSWECVVTDAVSNVASALVRAVFVETA